jgi:hypothetical protein
MFPFHCAQVAIVKAAEAEAEAKFLQGQVRAGQSLRACKKTAHARCEEKRYFLRQLVFV